MRSEKNEIRYIYFKGIVLLNHTMVRTKKTIEKNMVFTSSCRTH